jgi:hypothetical protein
VSFLVLDAVRVSSGIEWKALLPHSVGAFGIPSAANRRQEFQSRSPEIFANTIVLALRLIPMLSIKKRQRKSIIPANRR